MTIIDLFNSSVEKYASNPFLWEKTSDKYEPTAYAAVKNQVNSLAAALIELGVKKDDKIALLSEGRNAWIVSELAILHAGAVNVPLSVKLEESNDLIFRLVHSESRFVMVSRQQLPKIRRIMTELPLVEKVIVFDEIENLQEKEISLIPLMISGAAYLAKHPNCVTESVAQIKSSDVANISYTSGTTADPKGIMLTHRNYTANVEQALTLMTIPPTYRTLIILPLDHCFAHVAGFYAFMACGASVGTVQVGNSGMETLRNIPINIKELKPNLLLSAPALAKNFKKNIESNIKSQGKFVNSLFHFALKLKYAYNKEGHNKGQGLTVLYKPLLNLFDKILFNKIGAAFGGELDYFIGGAALLDIELQRFFYAINIPMYQGYGLSEATPVISSNGAARHKLGSSGWIVSPLELKICDENGEELPRMSKGEIVIKGENVMAGYWKNPEATAETVVDGWLHTGDMGYVDNDGYLYVVGRFKSLLISSDGEKYSPEGIEEAFSDNSRFIEQVVLYNNQSPYTVALMTVNKEMLKSYVKRKQPKLNWADAEAKELVLNKLQSEIDNYKKQGKFAGMFPERWLPAAVAVLPELFTEQNGLVNSTMKVMRNKVVERYTDRIEEMFTPEGKKIARQQNVDALS